jgi:hypothetical protein
VRRAGVLLAVWLLCAGAALVILARQLWCIATDPARAWAISIAIDRAANAAANGDHTETISSRANRARGECRRWGCVLCRILDWLQPNHCRDSAGT